VAKKPTVEPSSDVLVLLRHGDAGEPIALPHRDRRRPLTEKGRKQARRAGRALERMGLSPRDVWTSRLRRAQETGEVAGKAAGFDGPALESVALGPDASAERTLLALRASPRRGVRWLVGHEPSLSRLVGHLTGSPASAVRMGKGAVAVVEFPDRRVAAGAGRLVALLSPEALKALA
jgi:phosphohistidine phosphatase